MLQTNNVDFKADLREWAINQLKRHHVRHKNKDDLTTLLVKYYTYLNKYIVPQKRATVFSKELIQKMSSFPTSAQSALRKLAQWSSAGVDINCFQGRGLYGAGSRDYQNLLYDVVHLHLSAGENDVLPIIKKDGFAKPGEYILIACFSKEYAFFIDVIPHPAPFIPGKSISTEWTSKEIAKIIVHNWPELVAQKKLNGMSLCDKNGTRISLTDNDIAALTANHIMTFIDVDDSLYMLGEGITSSGIGSRSLRYADRTIHEAISIQKHFQDNKEQLCNEILDLIKTHHMKLPSQFDFHFQYIEELNSFAIVERCTGITYDYSNSSLLFSLPD